MTSWRNRKWKITMATTSESINRFLMSNALSYKWERVPGPEWPAMSHLTRIQSQNSYVQGGSKVLGTKWSAASHEKSPNSNVQGNFFACLILSTRHSIMVFLPGKQSMALIILASAFRISYEFCA